MNSSKSVAKWLIIYVNRIKIQRVCAIHNQKKEKERKIQRENRMSKTHQIKRKKKIQRENKMEDLRVIKLVNVYLMKTQRE